MTKLWNKKILLLLAAAALILLTGWYFLGANGSASDNTGVVVKGSLEQRVSIAGTVMPLRRTLVTAPYDGYVQKIYVKVGDEVKPNQPLVSVTQSLANPEPVFPLRAPYKGTVMNIQKREGENVKVGDTQEFLLRVDDLTKLYIDALAPEFDRLKLKKGQEAEVRASAIVDRSYKGIIRDLTLAPREIPNSNLQQYPVRIELVERDEKIGPGMSAVVDIITDRRENVLTLPHEYVRKNPDGSYFVLLESGEKRPIKVGMQNEESFEITEGLSEGDRVQLTDFLNP
jgi:multidrug efflux pump subunit AcrA (membrane-fusion protein)